MTAIVHRLPFESNASLFVPLTGTGFAFLEGSLLQPCAPGSAGFIKLRAGREMGRSGSPDVRAAQAFCTPAFPGLEFERLDLQCE